MQRQNFTLDENGITVDKKDKVVNIHVSGSIPEVNTPNSIDYMIYGNGEIVVTNTVTPSASAGNIARIGMKMTVAKDYEKLTYYGNGPQANYVDRNTGAKLGIYNSTVTEQFEKKYVKTSGKRKPHRCKMDSTDSRRRNRYPGIF